MARAYRSRLLKKVLFAKMGAASPFAAPKPADLPVRQSAKIDPVINLKTAMTHGLDVPAKLLALAGAVIE